MNVFIVYAHPSSNSFTHRAKEVFIEGLLEAGPTRKDVESKRWGITCVRSDSWDGSFKDVATGMPASLLSKYRYTVFLLTKKDAWHLRSAALEEIRLLPLFIYDKVNNRTVKESDYYEQSISL